MSWGDNTGNGKNGNKGGPWGGTGGAGKKPAAKKPTGTKKPAGVKKPTSTSGGAKKQSKQDNVFDLEKLFKNAGSGGGSGSNPEFNIGIKTIASIAVIALMVWLISGFYVVDASEEGIVLRFGEYNRTTTEGLNYHLPSPIEKSYIVKKTIINSVQIGYRTNNSSASRNATRRVSNFVAPKSGGRQPNESLMITGDTNIADVSFVVQWRIKNSYNFLFKIAETSETMGNTIKAVAQSAMREVIGRTKFAAAMTTQRNEIESNVQKIIQDVLDSYEAGIEVYAVNLNDVQNPDPVMPAFLDVETAKQDKQTLINRAKAYQNEIIPRARGEAQKMIQDAEAYKEQVISIATGEASRFASIYDEYRKAKDVTKKRIYLETMQKIMSGTDKVIMGKGGNGVVPYMALPEIKKRSESNNGTN